ncbi:hypothetical protein C6497_02210 [Candidatus Poribacteria bacterium]|nr:MAG: hypothetical protein C6497_02210 [Candidatus Poribacteria bacterium]
MDLYLNPSDVAEVIGVDEEIIKQVLERKTPEIEPYLRVRSGRSGTESEAEAVLQLRIDGLAPLITQLSYNIPTNDIIENLICQIVHIAYLNETIEKLESEKIELNNIVQTLQHENSDLRIEINRLQDEIPKNWKEHIRQMFK